MSNDGGGVELALGMEFRYKPPQSTCTNTVLRPAGRNQSLQTQIQCLITDIFITRAQITKFRYFFRTAARSYRLMSDTAETRYRTTMRRDRVPSAVSRRAREVDCCSLADENLHFTLERMMQSRSACGQWVSDLGITLVTVGGQLKRDTNEIT